MHGINLLFSTKPKLFSNICSISGLSPSSPEVDENICNSVEKPWFSYDRLTKDIQSISCWGVVVDLSP